MENQRDHSAEFKPSFSLRMKIILTFFLFTTIISLSLSFVGYRILSDRLFKNLQGNIKSLAQIGGLLIDREALKRLLEKATPGLRQEEVRAIEHSEDYKVIYDQLNYIRDINRDLIRYVYIFTPTEDQNTSLYIVDADLLKDLARIEAGETPEEELSHFNSIFDISDFDVARRVIKEKSPMVEEEYYYDEVYDLYSFTGYAPIFDADGNTLLAVLGIDVADTDVRHTLRNTTTLYLFIGIAALVLALLITVILSHLFTSGIIYLDRVVRRFGEKDLDVRASVKSKDEVGRLGFSFNQMAQTIQRYSNQLQALLTAYGRFVPHDFLRFLEKKSILDVKLGDQVQEEMTILFCDIRSFSTLSESMTPRETFNFLNSFLSRMGPEIRAHGGFIDKYIGDGIMALFPGKADDALRSAIGMQKKLVEYNRHRRKSGYIPIRIGIGIHTGTLMLGTVGEHERMDGSVISDAVNLASRLEGLTKEYDASIIVSADTLRLLHNYSEYHCRFLDKVHVKGRKKQVLIYEISDGDPPHVLVRKMKHRRDFYTALKLYHSRRFIEAGKLFALLQEKDPEDIVYSIYAKRCASLKILQTQKNKL